MHRIPNERRFVKDADEPHRTGNFRLQRREEFIDALDDLKRIGAGLFAHGENYGRGGELGLVESGDLFIVLHAVDRMADVSEACNRTVVIFDDHRIVKGSGDQKAVDIDRVLPFFAKERTDGQIDVRLFDGSANIIDVQSFGGHFLRVDPQADGIGRAVCLHLRNTFDNRHALRQNRIGVIVHLAFRHRGGSEAQE